MAVPFEVNLEQTNIVPREKTLFRGVWRRGFNWDSPPRFIAEYRRPTKPVPVQERDLRAFAKKAGYKIAGVWKETGSGAEDDRAERKKILVLAQAREIDPILVTELTRWGRSMLDLFHTLQDLQSWDVSLVAQTGLQFDLRSAQGKLIFASELLNKKPSRP